MNPNDFYDGGALLAFGGHKGSGFSILAQLVGVGLAGAHPDLLFNHRGGNGPMVIAIDVSAFVEPAVFVQRVEEQAAEIRRSEPAAGVDAVLLPGDPEVVTRQIREQEGIPVPESTWTELMALKETMLSASA